VEISQLLERIIETENGSEVRFYVTFEPFSYIIINELQKLKSNIERRHLYEAIFNDERAILLNEAENARTVMFANHNTRDENWKNTKEMAFALNDNDIDVCFLPETGKVPTGVKRADAIIKVNKLWSIADFKYCISSNDNTLSSELTNGFRQAKVIVLKLVNADLGIFREAIDYLKRNDIKIGDIILMNEYNKVLYITSKQLITDRYSYLIKGFL